MFGFGNWKDIAKHEVHDLKSKVDIHRSMVIAGLKAVLQDETNRAKAAEKERDGAKEKAARANHTANLGKL